jgi:hypothetical protein
MHVCIGWYLKLYSLQVTECVSGHNFFLPSSSKMIIYYCLKKSHYLKTRIFIIFKMVYAICSQPKITTFFLKGTGKKDIFLIILIIMCIIISRVNFYLYNWKYGNSECWWDLTQEVLSESSMYCRLWNTKGKCI